MTAELWAYVSRHSRRMHADPSTLGCESIVTLAEADASEAPGDDPVEEEL